MDRELSAQKHRDLKEAFELFNFQSGELAASYEALRKEVAQLNKDLALAYQRLEVQLAQHEQLLNLLPGAVLVLDIDGRVVEENQQARELFELDRHKFRDWSTLQEMFLSNSGELDEYLISRMQEPRRLVLTSTECPPPGGTILLFTDVTERSRHEQERRRRERLAEMGRMAANLAHQLRTPLATAMLYLSQLQESGASGDGRQLARALERLHRLEQLIRDTLRHVRLGEERGAEINADHVLTIIEQDQLPLYRQKNVALRFERSKNLTLPGTLEGWEAVLGNLLANALHFTPAGGEVLVTLCEEDGLVVLGVADQGPGFDPKLGSCLFEPFFTTRPDGTGLGLSIVNDYIEELGGRVTAENLHAGGCAIELRLPGIGTGLAT